MAVASFTNVAPHKTAVGVSVVIPTKDRPDFVHRAIASVLSQKDVEVEVIVVDDGSYEPLIPPLDPRVRVLRNEQSQGVSAARNLGIADARYEWLGFLDDDDFWAPTKLVEQIKAAASIGARWSVCGSVLVNIEIREISLHLPIGDSRQISADLCKFNAVPGGGSGAIIERSLIEELGGFQDGLSMVADWEMWHRIAHQYPCAIVRKPLVGYTQHDLSMTQTFDGYELEMSSLHSSSDYCEAEQEDRRAIYDGWLAGHIAKTDRVRAARLNARLALKKRSPRELIRAARYLLIPHTFSGRRALGLQPKNAPSEPIPWLDQFRHEQTSELTELLSD